MPREAVDYDAMLVRLREASAPKPDPSLGATRGEWAKRWKLRTAQTVKLLSEGVEAGKWERNMDWRETALGWRRVPVYRERKR